MINYTEKGHGLHIEIADQGHTLTRKDGVWLSSNDVAVQLIIDGYDPLEHAKNQKIEAIKAETLLHITNEMEAIKDFAMLEYTYHFWMSILAGAKSATTAWQEFIDVAVLGRAAIQTINDSIDLAFVESFDVKNDITWPA